jgi:hypothetical protein
MVSFVDVGMCRPLYCSKAIRCLEISQYITYMYESLGQVFNPKYESISYSVWHCQRLITVIFSIFVHALRQKASESSLTPVCRKFRHSSH